MRPSRPVPAMAAGSSLPSVTMRWTEGASGKSFGAEVGGAATGAGVFCAAGGWFAGVCSPAPEGCCAGLAAPAEAPPMRAITWLGVTVSPACARISASTPSAGAETSMATLSVSISTSTSSRLTVSPTLRVQLATVPSVTLSPMVGTVTSAAASGTVGSRFSAVRRRLRW